MAEAPSLYAESLEKLDQELTCPICLKHFEEPKVLPCCHYYCRECIVQMQARTRGKDYFQCPECRKETRLPGNDPDSLLTAFFVNRMKELFSMMQKAQGKVELTCESCRRGTTPVESFCRHCALFICQSCEEAHRTMRPFSDHVVVPLDDLRQNTAAHFPVKKDAQMKCEEHGGKMKLYCHDCHQLICRDCIVKDHKEHEYDFVNKAAVQCRASLKESVTPLRKIQVSLNQAVVETEKATSAVSQSGADIAAAIDRKFDELIASVQKRREELHCEAREKLEANQKSLTAQRKNIQQATAEVQSMIEFVDHKSQQANDQELLGLQKQIHDRVNEVAQKYSNPVGQFKPAEVCHLKLKYNAQSTIEGITLFCQGTPSSPTLASDSPVLLLASVTPPHVHQPASPPTSELSLSPPPPPSDLPCIFSNLSQEVLALLAKIPEGELPGVQYHPKEGTVNIESRSKEELEDRISRFQTAYQGILGARKLKVEPVEVPPALDDEKAEQITASFNKQYNQCVFIYCAEPRVVKVVSTSSRQFDQAKKRLVQELASSPDPSVATKVEFSRKEEVIVLPGGRKLTLKRANIVEEEVNVIVNPANSRLQHGGGVAGAINDASYGEVQKYSDRYFNQKGPVPVGQGAWTRAGGTLKCKFVFHAVGPDSSYTRAECERLLSQVVSVTLQNAEKANHNSIAIPALSSGIFGVSKDIVTRCVVDAVVNFRFTKTLPVLSDIRIVIIDKPTYSCFARYFVQKRALLMQSPRKPLEPHKSQSAGIGQWGPPNTSAAPVSDPPALEQNSGHPLMSMPTTALPQGQSIVKSEGSAKPKDYPLPNEALTLDDLPMLNTHLRGVSKKWYSLGFYLGFTTDQLANLVSTVDVTCDPAFYLSKVLFAWLRRTNPPTLEVLCRALSHERIGEKMLALQLLQQSNSFQSAKREVKTNPTISFPPNSSRASSATEEDKNCPICLDEFTNPTHTKCGHKFCSSCLEKALKYDPFCPTCQQALRPIVGKQPQGGRMTHKVLFGMSLPGYQEYNTIQIDYWFPNGVQGPEHPNPGRQFSGTSRTAYLPDNHEGREVLQLLKKAFDARLIFTVGTSVITGTQNTVVWNDIHHKTSMHGGPYGYPDPTYLQRVKADLAAKGIVPDIV